MATSKSWQKFTTRIPSIFFNRTLRFALLRIICISTVLLICNIPSYSAPDSLKKCDEKANSSWDTVIAGVSTFGRKLHIYVYTVCSCTFLHHLASAFGPRFSLPGIIDFSLIIGEAIPFFLQAITGQWASPISSVFYTPGGAACEIQIEQALVPKVSAWFISISLIGIAILRCAEALESDGRYFFATYDISGFKLTPRRAPQGTRPNDFKVITGVHFWTEHFTGEGKWLVLSRGIVALSLMIVAIAIAFNAVILDAFSEGAQLPVKVTRSISKPITAWPGGYLYAIVGFDEYSTNPQINFSDAITVSWAFKPCLPYTSGTHPPAPRDNSLRLLFVTFQCKTSASRVDELTIMHPSLLVQVNYTTLSLVLGPVGRPTVQVMIGHCGNDSSLIIRRTKLPVVLLPGVNLLGFAQQHVIQQFRYPLLASLGISSYDEFVVSEITHLQPNFREISMSNYTASLLVLPRIDFSDLRIVQDQREKSVLKGFSSVGGLLTVLGFIFGALFGSSLVRVVFGVKPLSISGIAHAFSESTQKSYKEKYCNINPQTIDEGKSLDALLINHLLHVDIFSKDATSTVFQAGEENDAESSGEKEVAVEPVNDESSRLITAAP